jgi:geranylgeranyl pyrophosphate synthase
MNSLQLPVLNLPRPMPLQRERAPQSSIPQSRAEREQCKELVEKYVAEVCPVPPLSFEELRTHADEFSKRYNFDAAYRDYIAVILNSEVWREQLATVPYERRLLLLPKCLRVEDKCPAPFDDFGLLCKRCGLCSIQELQDEAERLGYAVLVAEGSAIVMAIIQTGKIDAIVGVSCINVLERAFPFMESAAIPGIAIPLLQDDCRDTTVDMEWVWDVIHLSSEDKTRRLNLDELRREVDSWFGEESLNEIFGPAQSQTEQISREWLAKEGKRWRPFLTACAFKALQADPDAPLPSGLRHVAVAVECFHKASLIHDDIEDNDAERYDEKTLHEEHGMAVALNAGDFLLGEGYRLLALSDAPANIKSEMIRIAAQGHRTLCVGQGAELCWARGPQPLSSLEVLGIFRQKTAPAFEVALVLGAAYAGALDEELSEVLTNYSEALGIAYQIRDDLDDLRNEGVANDLKALRPSLPLAIAHEKSKGAQQEFMTQVWQHDPTLGDVTEKLQEIMTKLGIEERCERLLESYKEEAIRSLVDLENSSLKGLLRRVIGKIFVMQIEGWCNEFETRNATGRAPVAEIAG